MKLTIRLVILSVLFLQKWQTNCRILETPYLPATYIFLGGKTDDLGCLKSLEGESSEFSDLMDIKLPTTRAGKCIYQCMLRSTGVVTDNGLINVTKLMDSLNTFPIREQSLKSITATMKHCNDHKRSTEVRCEATYILLECAVQEGVKRGWTPAHIIALIRNPYNAPNKDIIAEIITVRPIIPDRLSSNPTLTSLQKSLIP